MAPLNHPGAFPKSFPKIPAPYKGAAGNFGKSGPDRKRLISGKTGNFGNPEREGSAQVRMGIENLGGGRCQLEVKHD
ncbi:hypothetical protein [Burkholderia ubonensis]|uniref:hypothetical protein n=1 Tax=Burkholderia ubonensis TaxID=101571 RepID=UPI000A901697|nr:hypothetical protein [Burkholderia ubonensis]